MIRSEHAAGAPGMAAILADTARQARDDGRAVGILTGLALVEGADVTLHLRHQVAPMHLVMAALVVAAEAEQALRRAAGDNRHKIAALTVALHALRQAMEDGR